MKIEQHPYLSPAAVELRHRDGVPPWGVHPCEVDSLATFKADTSPFGESLRQARELRDELER